MKETIANCPTERTLQIISGRWKVLILWQLFPGVQRFSDLQRALNAVAKNGVTPQMLTRELRQLEADGIVHREVYKQVPPKVEYWLTPLGESLRPVIDVLIEWGKRYEQEIGVTTQK